MHYNTKRHSTTRGRTILMVVLAVITIANAVFLLNRAEEARNRWEPDVEYPMANANISWEQTYYPGGMEQ